MTERILNEIIMLSIAYMSLTPSLYVTSAISIIFHIRFWARRERTNHNHHYQALVLKPEGCTMDFLQSMSKLIKAPQ